MGDKHPSAQRIFIEGTGTEKRQERIEANLRAKDFNERYKSSLQHEREKALMEVIEKVGKKEESIDYLRSIVSGGLWLRELDTCSRKTKWLETLFRRVE